MVNDEEGKIKGYPQGSFSSKFPLTVMTNIVTCRPPQGKKITKIQGRSDIFAPIGLIEMICCFKGPELLGGGCFPPPQCFFLLQEDTDQGKLY